MCGIYGFMGIGFHEDLLKMQSSIVHRGPDSSGVTSYQTQYKDVEVHLGHVRLSILDVSEAGNQPMQGKNGRYTIIFNGEIYNFLDLKKDCESQNANILWKGHSDTEILLVCFELLGIEETIKRLVGMFAIVLWDNDDNKLYLIRDRIGEKPLYYGYADGTFLFASELKAIEKHSGFKPEVNEVAAVNFLTKGYVPNELSIYEGIFKLKPGTILEIDLEIFKNRILPQPKMYWSLDQEVQKASKNQFKGTYEEAKDELEKLLFRSIKEQSIADVPVGAFLSGGVDSSLVCALLQKNAKSEILTFTIGMPEPGVNEAKHAELVAKHLKTKHTCKYLSTSEILNKIDDLIAIWDEPFGDSSQLPTFFVSEEAKKHVQVSLSGDGADEFLYGYIDHQVYTKFKKYTFISSLGLDKFLLYTLKVVGFTRHSFFKKIESLSYLLEIFKKFNNLGDVHENWHNKFWNSKLPVRDELLELSTMGKKNAKYSFNNVGHYDGLNYLPNDILVKVDRASMAVSLETRAPFLDHRVLEFLFSLPEDFIYKKGTTKRIVRDILYKYVPRDIIERPKQGFSVPMSYWLRNDLKIWAEDILKLIPSNSVFWNKDVVNQIWKEHQTEYRDHPEKIWNIIVLESFFRRKKLLHHKNTNI
ncbi:asparagine synthase (glutamine-hydrolyzing) [Flavobacterium sp. 2]|uniref:asparagine synthase (glutamine-hydrolyzing) n=1 Tax=Flavobacterium sp. 2 TaxID=308053 RepID=UPI000C17EDB9|nr:asparagine synthase (glutamine-hydrolyzing) [Flavobacterium sp. 2]PIF59335.1 asparagine synthase (glutamine-hydrolysing) [Flavobacterium sp. 2]